MRVGKLKRAVDIKAPQKDIFATDEHRLAQIDQKNR